MTATDRELRIMLQAFVATVDALHDAEIPPPTGLEWGWINARPNLDAVEVARAALSEHAETARKLLKRR